MSIILNKTDCGTAIRGTGTLGCKVDINYLTQFVLLERGTSLDTAVDTLDQAKINELVQSEQMIVLPKHDSFENQSGDTVYEELPSGVKLTVRNGLYEFYAMFSSGIYLSNALASLSSKSWDLWMLDFDASGNGRLWGEQTSNGKFKGFSTSLVNAENKSFSDGSSTSTKTPLRIQLSTAGTQAMRSRVAYLSSNEEVDLSNLNGINDVVLSATNLVAASLAFKTVLASDNSTVISSVTDISNWKFTNTSTNTDVSPSEIVFESGEYRVSGISAGTYAVRFYDNTNSKNVVVAGSNYFESNTTTITVT